MFSRAFFGAGPSPIQVPGNFFTSLQQTQKNFLFTFLLINHFCFKLTALQLSREFSGNTEYMFSISFRKHHEEKKENNMLTFDYQNVNSLYSRHHYLSIAR